MPQKVLIVDDCKLVNRTVKGLLRSLNVEMFSAYNGEAGVALAVSMLPDLILLDVQMPGIDGYEVCRRLKTDPATAMIPVVFLTADSSTEEKIRGLEMGGFDYVTKPFDSAELRARVMVGLRTKYLLDVLSQRAMIDGLTGLWNRAFFQQRLVVELANAAAAGHHLSCILLDIDYFKRVNDTHGHLFGDHVLRFLSQTLLDLCRPQDIVCRYGGEEILILLPGVALQGATGMAERLRAAIADLHVDYGEHSTRLTCSFGVADARVCGTCSVVQEADDALYRAKAAGRNRVETALSKPLAPQSASAVA